MRAVGRPNWVAVFAFEGGKPCISAVLQQPNVARYRRLVVLPIRILIAFLVVIENVSTLVDADIEHCQTRKEPGPTAVSAYFIHLRERSACENDGFLRGHTVC